MSSRRPIFTTPSETFPLAADVCATLSGAAMLDSDSAAIQADTSLVDFIGCLRCGLSCQGFVDDFRDVVAQPVVIADSLELRLCSCLPLLVESLPAVEGASHARANLRIDAIQGDDLVGDKSVSGAVCGMKANVV